MKNMINALFSSQTGGTKGFRHSKDGDMFGWKAIIDLYARECQRREWDKQELFQNSGRHMSSVIAGQN